jgi:hypothetical protein
MKISAITRKNQAQVNKAVKYLVKYNELNDLRNIADGNGNEKEYNKLDNQCARCFDNYLEVIDELPKREIAQIEKALY